MRIIDRPIEVITAFDEKGIMTPIRIRIKNDEDAESTVIPITKILFMDKLQDIDRSKLWLFRCRTQNGDRWQDFEIKYNILTCKWYLHKM